MSEMRDLRISARTGMFIVDGSSDAAFPKRGSPPVVAGPELICVAGRVATDAPTEVRFGPIEERGSMVAVYDGDLATPDRVVRLLSGDDLRPDEDPLLATVQVDTTTVRVRVFLSDVPEPDRILLVLGDG